MTMRSGVGLLLVPFALLMSSCARPAAVDNRVADAGVLRALDAQWSAAAARKDLGAVVGFYADDAVLLAPNVPIATDAKSIRASRAGLLGLGAVSWKVTKAEVARSGELGYLYGTYELVMRGSGGGAPVTDAGKLVEVGKKQVDGTWKCVVDTYNSDSVVVAAPDIKNRSLAGILSVSCENPRLRSEMWSPAP